MSPQRRRSEFEIIADVLAPLSRGANLAFDLTDDAALVEPRPGECLVTTADALVSGIHFPRDEAPDFIARKALRVNLSDLAAMGATPIAYFMTMALAPDVDDRWIESFAAGLAADQAEFQVTLAGGDLVSTPHEAVLSITMMGSVPRSAVMRRNGAQVGDRLFVSGTIGDAHLGLRQIQGKLDPTPGSERLVERYRLPRPRLSLGVALRGIAHAGIDVSDGLVADLGHICSTSSVSARIRAADVPLSQPAKTTLQADPTLLSSILTGGDDYELLFAAPAGFEPAAMVDEVGIEICEIGEIVEGAGVTIVADDGSSLALDRTGYTHR